MITVVPQESNGPELRRSVRKRNVRMTEPAPTTEQPLQSEDFKLYKQKKGKKRKSRFRVSG